MPKFYKSFEDYFRIPVILKSIGVHHPQEIDKYCKIFNRQCPTFPTDERYNLNAVNPHTEILLKRQNCVQKILFLSDDFGNDWPEFEIIYKAKFVIGVIFELNFEESKENFQKFKKAFKEEGLNLIGIIFFGDIENVNFIQEENVVNVSSKISDAEICLFLEPWMYSCLSLMESIICSSMFDAKLEENTLIVFNKNQEKSEQKIMKRKKKYRCIKVCGDYCMMLQLYKEAFAFYNQADENLRKIDDYIWIMGCLQGKVACAAVCNQLNISNYQQYIEDSINQILTISKKTKIWTFQCESYFRIFKLYYDQPDKLDEMIRNFLSIYLKNYSQDDKFGLYSYIGYVYEQGQMFRKRNYYYYLASQIYLQKKTSFSMILLKEIQLSPSIQAWPELYSKVLDTIIHQDTNSSTNGHLQLELLTKCSTSLTHKEKQTALQALNFHHYQYIHLKHLSFLELQEFYCIQSPIKPKLNRIGNRESPKKIGGGFFMSWKKQQKYLFQQNEIVTFKGTIVNKISLPIHLKVKIKIVPEKDSLTQPLQQTMVVSVDGNNLFKFETITKAIGSIEETWKITTVTFIIWNFHYEVHLPNAIKYEIYEKQPQVSMLISKEIEIEESSRIEINAKICYEASAPEQNIVCSLMKINISIYYNLDVGFQQNQFILDSQDNFHGINFDLDHNLQIVQSQAENLVNQDKVKNCDGVIRVHLKKFKVQRKYINRIEYNLEYVGKLSSKYQSCKYYMTKCMIKQSIWCELGSISTPTLKSYELQKHQDQMPFHQNIIEDYYLVQINIFKAAFDLHPYKISNQHQSFVLSNQNCITFTEQKIKIEINSQTDTNHVVGKLVYHWCSVLDQNKTGKLEFDLRFDPLMTKSNKDIKFNVGEIRNSKKGNKGMKFEYEISSQDKAVLSHEMVIHPMNLEIQRGYVLRGKTKMSYGKELINHVQNCVRMECHFKCKNSYRVGLRFQDEQIYWHPKLITIGS